MKKSVIVTFEGDDADLESFLQWLTGHRLVMEIAEPVFVPEPPESFTMPLADVLIELDHQVDALVLTGDGCTFTHPDSDAFARSSQKAKRLIKTLFRVEE